MNYSVMEKKIIGVITKNKPINYFNVNKQISIKDFQLEEEVHSFYS